MFKKFGDILNKTPWWALILMGLFTLILLGLFATPFNVIRLAESGATKEERSAIKREIDTAFFSNALGFAEGVVSEMRERTNDPARRTELDAVLRDLKQGRKELDREVANAARNTGVSARETVRAARDAAREVARTARDNARSAAEAARDAAKEKIDELKEARKEAKELQRKVGIEDEAALAPFDKKISAAKDNQRAAEEALAKLSTMKTEGEVDTGPREISMGIDLGDVIKIEPRKVTPAPSGATKAPAKSDGLSLNGKIGDTSIQTKVITDADGKFVRKEIQIGEPDAPAPVAPPAPPAPASKPAKPAPTASPAPPAPPATLAPEVRQQIRDKVSSDVRRIGIGSAMILFFIPVFVMLLVAKVFIGRSRRAVDFAEIKKKEAESANVNRQVVEAKLQALQAQVEPHFLYNTLANVQALTEIDPVQANQMTGHLINYLRAALPKMRESTSTIGQEVELVRAYLNILKMRMGDRLAFDIDMPSAYEGLPFPPLMLPSLVENAIKHGLEPQREGGRIDVVVTRDGDRLLVAVRDTGRGLTDKPIQAGGGVGLTNIRERLQALFGDAGKLTLESNDPKGVVATIEVPASGIGAPLSARAPIPVAPPPPTGFWPRLRSAFSKTHSAWSRIMAWILVALMVSLLIAFVGALISLATGSMPLNIGPARITGAENMAIGTALLTVAFAALALVAVILVALLYGLGFFFVGLLIVIPIIILVSMVPALAPFALVAFLIYWFWWRKRKNRNV